VINYEITRLKLDIKLIVNMCQVTERFEFSLYP